MPTWDASQYLQFNDERTRPCRELVSRIAVAAPQRVIDLGCGPGNSTAVLAQRWPQAELTGLDSSPEMIAAASNAEPHHHWQVGDIATWADEQGDSFEVVFSNAALQWVGDHKSLFSKLLSRVSAGGALAVQMPGNLDAPAHRIMRELAVSPEWRNHFPSTGVREWHVYDLPFYYNFLAPIAASIDLWATEYIQVMPSAKAIVEWYKGTGLRPFLEALPNDTKRTEFITAYLHAIRKEYPTQTDDRILFPFRRMFLIAYRKDHR